MSALRRAFVAVVPPADVLDAIERAIAPLRCARADLRWAPPEQWHLTLQFLGAVADGEALRDALHAGLAGCVAPRVALGGMGAFRSARHATVLWIGVREGHGALAELASRVGAAAAMAGLAVEDRPYRSHLTIARASVPRDLRRQLADAPPEVGPVWLGSEVVLFESVLGRGGARHEARGRWVLGSAR